MRRRRLIGYGLFAASLVLVVNALIGENGYLATIRAEQSLAHLQEDLNRTRLDNQILQERIERLKTDPTALEEAARRELGLIKEGETIVILKDRTPPPPPAAPRRR